MAVEKLWIHWYHALWSCATPVQDLIILTMVSVLILSMTVLPNVYLTRLLECLIEVKKLQVSSYSG